MLPKKLRSTASTGPEAKVQDAIRAMLVSKGWYVVKVPGTVLMAGMPDLFCTHRDYRMRWIEVKDPERTGNVFTQAQRDRFAQLDANGTPIYVLTGATEKDYQLLFKSPNWKEYVKY